MSSLPGGPAEKAGNRYELSWTVSELLRMLRGDGAQSIRIEQPGLDKAEFVVQMAGKRELHQAKRTSVDGKWTLRALAAGGTEILQAMQRELTGNEDRFVFVSDSPATELKTLSDRARDAQGLAEYRDLFLEAKTWAKTFQQLQKMWGNCDDATAYDLLRRIEIRVVDDVTLDERNEAIAGNRFLADPMSVYAELRTIAIESVHQVMSKKELLDRLAKRGLQIRRLVRPEDAPTLIGEATNRYLGTVRKHLINNKLNPRPVAKQVHDLLLRGSGGVVLLGGAGAGKTGCVIELVEMLQEKALPVLVIRMDQIPPVGTTAELGQKLGLEESPVLALAAAGPKSVLIIDQLDAMSTASGRGPGALDLVADLLNEIQGQAGPSTVHAVLVCRSFDWGNDHRFKRLMPEGRVEIVVQEFDAEEVSTALTEAGFAPVQFTPQQLGLLRLPQNLSLFLESGFDPAQPPGFGTQKELFDRYWDRKRQTVADRCRGQDHWTEVTDLLVEEMTSSRTLAVPKERLDHLSADYLHQMVSEGVLTFDGYAYGFGHESFYDYCFARQFRNQKSESLVAVLTASEQHLSRRAQVRMVLAYLRDADRASYLENLRELLTEERIRGHIQDLTLALLADVRTATEEEWAIWEPLLNEHLQTVREGRVNGNALSVAAWRRFFGSNVWFDFVDGRGLPAEWLADESLADMAVAYLRAHQRERPDRVTALLEPYADQGNNWPRRLRFVVEWADHAVSRRFCDLVLRLVDNGVLDEARGPIAQNSTFWSMFYDLSERRPEWIPELIAHWLRHRLQFAGDNPGTREGKKEVFPNDTFAEEPFLKAGSEAPEEFVQHVLPVVLELSDAMVVPEEEPPRRDWIWRFMHRGSHLSASSACLQALDKALSVLAADPARDLTEIVGMLRARSTYIANFLLLGLYAAAGARFAEDAATLLAAEPWRFQCGYSDSSHWRAGQLIQAIAPHCSQTARDALQTTIVGYRSSYERTPRGLASSGYSSHQLLAAIPPELRNDSAKAWFHEMERKFGTFEPREPKEIGAGWVDSPIAEASIEKMSDDDWLSAIETYNAERGSVTDPFKGGAWELALALKKRVEKEPERFAKLALRIPATSHPHYLSQLLAGLKGAEISADLKVAACEKAYADSRETHGQQIADALGGITDRLPNHAVEMLAWLATQHPDPREDIWPEQTADGEHDWPDEILTNGINTTRGRAAEAIRDQIFNNAEYVDRFRDTLNVLVHDQSVAVLSCVASTIYAVAAHDVNRALGLLDTMVISDERLLATPHMCQFLRVGVHGHLDRVSPYLRRMIESSNARTNEAGAQLAGLAVLYEIRPAASLQTGWWMWPVTSIQHIVRRRKGGSLARRALKGGAKHRVGLAQIAAANVANPECRPWCEPLLRMFFNDSNEDVRTEAASCFRYLNEAELDKYEGLFTTFSDSAALGEDSFAILHALETSTRRLPGAIIAVCQRFLDRFGAEAGDVRTGRFGDVRTVATLVFRTYQQHQADEWTPQVLDLVDRLCLSGLGDPVRQMQEFER